MEKIGVLTKDFYTSITISKTKIKFFSDNPEVIEFCLESEDEDEEEIYIRFTKENAIKIKEQLEKLLKE